MKRWLTSFAACLVAVFVLHAAQAGQVTGVVTTVQVRDTDGVVYAIVNGTITGRASCASGTTYWMISNENSETGKRLYSLLLAAKVSGIAIQLTGTGTCVRWGDGEDISSIAFNG